MKKFLIGLVLFFIPNTVFGFEPHSDWPRLPDGRVMFKLHQYCLALPLDDHTLDVAKIRAGLSRIATLREVLTQDRTKIEEAIESDYFASLKLRIKDRSWDQNSTPLSQKFPEAASFFTTPSYLFYKEIRSPRRVQSKGNNWLRDTNRGKAIEELKDEFKRTGEFGVKTKKYISENYLWFFNRYEIVGVLHYELDGSSNFMTLRLVGLVTRNRSEPDPDEIVSLSYELDRPQYRPGPLPDGMDPETHYIPPHDPGVLVETNALVKAVNAFNGDKAAIEKLTIVAQTLKKNEQYLILGRSEKCE